jgi:hypothetical protein
MAHHLALQIKKVPPSSTLDIIIQINAWKNILKGLQKKINKYFWLYPTVCLVVKITNVGVENIKNEKHKKFNLKQKNTDSSH